MSLFDTLFLLAQASAEKPSSGGIFSVPNFFFALIGACILMVIIGAICDHRATREVDYHLSLLRRENHPLNQKRRQALNQFPG